jgi:proline dehydrogenase
MNLENTETSFASKTNRDLRKARVLYSIMNVNWIVKTGIVLLPLALKARLPVRRLIYNSIFRQFVGGESLPDTRKVLLNLQKSNVKAILDYGAEGKISEGSFDTVCNEFLTLIDYASDQPDVPFISIKITALGRFARLEKLNPEIIIGEAGLQINTGQLSESELGEWDRVLDRIERVCARGEEKSVGVLVDAEESWIQDTIDAVTMGMMSKHNRKRVIVFNTIQFYRVDRLRLLRLIAAISEKEGYIPGIKIVRGAYMEKERLRALEFNYSCQIQPDKISTDRDFNSALEYCIANLQKISVIVASHNDQSVLLAIELLDRYSLPKDHPYIHFSQLYGMSDNITFNLAGAGYQVSKYLPYGPLEDVIPYLLRRAQENTSVSNQTGKELRLIISEVKRRNLAAVV